MADVVHGHAHGQERAFKAHWWVLRCCACSRVTYDDAFVADMFARLAVVWERVMHYRTDRDSYLAEVGAATSPPIPSSLAAHQQQSDLTKFAFVDDDVYSTVPLCSK